MNKIIQFQRIDNIISIVCSQFEVFNCNYNQFINLSEQNDTIYDLSVQIMGCNFKDSQALTGLLYLINQFKNLQQLKLIICFDNAIPTSQFQHLAKHINNLHKLRDLSLSLDTNVLDLEQKSAKYVKQYEEDLKVMFQQITQICNLELTINESNSNKNVDSAIQTTIFGDLDIYYLVLDIKDNNLNYKQQEKIYSNLYQLCQLKSLQISIANNEEPIYYQSIIKTLHQNKLIYLYMKLENCVINLNQPYVLESQQQLSIIQLKCVIKFKLCA
ncbi:hypothetical protein TTHERM_00101220 (macronuclear) [Tetrahymena thermophila SB210]|uniref:Kinase domain protein n=1 Tax=Tetrahymena thermophila (strain SB210) TaxID=312017 RepID=Q234S7_TETTS|nr:hypothetical protein TTHERM_00101220 [Tetrahymena thermophila SB210]EAR91926.2 hypothetical protein TTHERM_00101220 [Tetrahymena thermophila SB210]|eukprot:XP_001012171.2 hypothetical protein TTHERM_00101220 [Tetrahymena thermophila SB210]